MIRLPINFWDPIEVGPLIYLQIRYLQYYLLICRIQQKRLLITVDLIQITSSFDQIFFIVVVQSSGLESSFMATMIAWS